MNSKKKFYENKKKLDAFFYPKSVAVIGASRDTGHIGHVILENFASKFNGKIFPVNPNAKTILGLKSYKSVLKIKEKIDLAIICVPAIAVPLVFDECGKKRIPAIIIISAGFNEIGNNELSNQLMKLIKKYKNTSRVIGPNCLGILNTESNVDTLFMPSYRLNRPKKGNVSFISQSGALGSAVLDWAAMEEYGIAKFISYGNAFDLDETDLIEYLVYDKKTKVICAYIEGLKNGRKFFEKMRYLSKIKPIILLKGGTSSEGIKAVTSHTGSMAGSIEIFNALFKQTKLIKAENLLELFSFARIFSRVQKPKGKRIQIITDGGGYGVLAADAVAANNLVLAKATKKTIEKIRKIMPSHIILGNPMDLTGDVTNERYKTAINACLEDKNIDILLVIVLYQVPLLDSKIVEVIAELNALKKKPIIVLSVGGTYSELHRKALESEGVINFNYPFIAVKSIKALVDFYLKN